MDVCKCNMHMSLKHFSSIFLNFFFNVIRLSFANYCLPAVFFMNLFCFLFLYLFALSSWRFSQIFFMVFLKTNTLLNALQFVAI